MILGGFLMYLIPAGLGWLLLRPFVRGRIHANQYDFGLLYIPWLVWTSLMFIDGEGKSLANIIESVFLGAAVPFVLLLRVLVTRKLSRISEATVSRVALATHCVLAVC